MTVYIGFWTNWSKGRALGATLTVSARNGTLLVAFLALFVTWTGNQLWSILCYVSYRLWFSENPRNAFHRQILVLIRNGATDTQFLWRILKLSWIWRSNSQVPVRNGIPLIALALVHVVSLSLAGIFSSRVTVTTGDALLVSDYCGFPNFDRLEYTNVTIDELKRASALYVSGAQLFDNGRIYSRFCYDPTTLNKNSDCQAYVWKQKTKRGEACPFANGSCITSSLVMDSGFIDSNNDLGINAPERDRIQFRKVMTCAVIPAEEKYSSGWTGSESLPEIYPFPTDPSIGATGVRYKIFYLGPGNSGQVKRPFTFFVANFSAPARAYSTLSYISFASHRGLSGFTPIQDFRRNDAEVTIWILQNGVSYTAPVLDPWFKSTRAQTLGSSQVWKSDYTASAIGCTEQYQFCNLTSCTNLSTLDRINVEAVSPLNFNPMQLATFDLLWRIASVTRMDYLTFMLQDSILLAKDRLFGEFMMSTPLPDNQWEQEVQNLQNISLTVLHSLLTHHVDQPDIQISLNTTFHEYVIKENSTEALRICKNQKITTTAYYSFSVLGLVIILSGGSLIVLLSNALPPLVSRLRSRNRKMSAVSQLLEVGWRTDDVLALDGIALDGHGIGPWREKWEVPIPEDPGAKFLAPWIEKMADGYGDMGNGAVATD